MKKRGESLLVRILLVALIFIFLNIGFFIYSSPQLLFSEERLTGLAIRESVVSYTSSWNYKQWIVFFVQIPILLIIIILIVIKYIKNRKKRKEITKEDIKLYMKANQTDLDVLYNVLKNKKRIHISSISEAFKVDKKIAMEWCKTLESSNMASIEYPGLGEPYIKYDSTKIK